MTIYTNRKSFVSFDTGRWPSVIKKLVVYFEFRERVLRKYYWEPSRRPNFDQLEWVTEFWPSAIQVEVGHPMAIINQISRHIITSYWAFISSHCSPKYSFKSLYVP